MGEERGGRPYARRVVITCKFKIRSLYNNAPTQLSTRGNNKTTLYVVFADLSNAFPSTDQATLWLKMRGAGTGGPIFDWLCMLYKQMVYTSGKKLLQKFGGNLEPA
jgi:hypothetical protein